MSMVLGLISLAGAAWVLVKRYERHLQGQVGPWMAGELKGARIRKR